MKKDDDYSYLNMSIGERDKKQNQDFIEQIQELERNEEEERKRKEEEEEIKKQEEEKKE